MKNTPALRWLQCEGDGEDAADERESPTITSESATIQELSDFAIPYVVTQDLYWSAAVFREANFGFPSVPSTHDAHWSP